MANEITIGASLKVSNGTLKDSRAFNGQLADMLGYVKAGDSQNLTNTWEALDLGDVSTPGWAMFVNLDANNDIQLATDDDNTDIFATIPPRMTCGPMYLADADPIFVRAASGTAQLDKLILEA